MDQYHQINSFLNTSSFFYTIAIGMDSRYTYASPNYDRNFGRGKGSLTGQHFSVTLHPDDVAICGEAGVKCFEDPGKLFPARLRKHDGRGGYVITQWEMQAMLSDNGAPQGIFCVGYNITEFVATQQKLNQAESHLDEISFIQSHGVRKPLANIIGIASLFDSSGDPHQSELAGMLKESAEELDAIVREISAKNCL